MTRGQGHTLPLIDAHLHLQDPRLDTSRESVIAEMRACGIGQWVVNGTDETDWETVANLAGANDEVVPCFGLHPWKSKQRSADWLTRLNQKLDQFPAAGVGEIGLDKWIRDHDLNDQEEVFRAQLEIAVERRRPAMIHCLQCFGRLRDVLAELSLPDDFRFLLHSYGGPLEMVDSFIELGAFFSFSGYFLKERKAATRAAFAKVPDDRLLIETDAPDMPLPKHLVACSLPPDGASGRLNHPANLAVIYRQVAALRGLEEGELRKQVADNFRSLVA